MCPIWNPEIETATRERMLDVQLERLKKTVALAYGKVGPYRQRLDEAGVSPDSIQSLEDVRRIPFTVKTDLRDAYPFGLFAVDVNDLVRIHSSSGTTGKPTVVGYNLEDLNTWTELCARIGSLAGVVAGDRVQMAFLFGMFTGGWGMHYGLERIGATMIPAGAGNTERQLMMMQDFGTTAIVCTPSYALYLAEVGESHGIDFHSLPLRVGLFGGEPTTASLKREIEAKLGILATDNYGLSEVMGPGVSGECEFGNMHISEDHFLWEIIDPETGEVLPEGEHGELVLTTLTKTALPILRYRTRDLTRIRHIECPCGRTTAVMDKVRKRTDDMLIIRGVNVYPSQVEDACCTIDGIRAHYLIVVDRKAGMDDLEVRLEVDENVFSDSMADMEVLRKQVAEQIHSIVGLNARVVLVEPGSIERTQGKAKHVLDLRQDGE